MHADVCMYVCRYVCKRVCTSVCLYVSMYVKVKGMGMVDGQRMDNCKIQSRYKSSEEKYICGNG